MASATVNMDSSIDESFEFHSYSLNSELAYGLNSEPYARWTYYERKLEYVYRHLAFENLFCCDINCTAYIRGFCFLFFFCFYFLTGFLRVNIVVVSSIPFSELGFCKGWNTCTFIFFLKNKWLENLSLQEQYPCLSPNLYLERGLICPKLVAWNNLLPRIANI
jgi:hypothetical protein